ncbi:hypothetical protein Micbo1qcDRAFT_217035 [Microdochium bolleyi]|uniref:Uncharacterized protein n=1 Tax=Microdochium bolleyi TaxID=196109 RepID=A0A136JDS6_9PEZI|nr:hypothetical protein Micbo1qcDRAFT_217035 [Microdochium bolleyi]
MQQIRGPADPMVFPFRDADTQLPEGRSQFNEAFTVIIWNSRTTSTVWASRGWSFHVALASKSSTIELQPVHSDPAQSGDGPRIAVCLLLMVLVAEVTGWITAYTSFLSLGFGWYSSSTPSSLMTRSAAIGQPGTNDKKEPGVDAVPEPSVLPSRSSCPEHMRNAQQPCYRTDASNKTLASGITHDFRPESALAIPRAAGTGPPGYCETGAALLFITYTSFEGGYAR